MKPFLIGITLWAGALTACSNDGANEQSADTTMQQQINVDSNAAAAPTADENSTILPSFTVQDVNGKTINLQGLKGKKVFVNLWASWCPPCRREMPSIEKLAKSVDKNKVAFVLLSLDDNFDKAKAFAKRQQLSLPIYYPAENLPALFNVQAIPTTFFFDEEGRLFQRTDGGDDYNTEVYRKVLR
ncbi:MAG TPA: TlpA disulfide reductase family protein [Flavisolibacter sp.]|nr:TlpA disulfide reductase family protein [Flavisolibacter sp.]